MSIPTSGLSLEQAPPLSIPVSFFATVPLAMLLAGILLIATGSVTLAHPRAPTSIALTHVGTIGMLLIGMMGALYQMIPVVAGGRVPAVRLAHGVHVLMLAGLAGFAWRLLGGPVQAMSFGALALALGSIGFLLPIGLGLARSATRNESTLGMRLALISMAAVAAIGLLMSRGYAGGELLWNHSLWIRFHLTVALLGLVGGLIVSVSWQVLPMFYLARATDRRYRRAILAALLTVFALPLAAFLPQAVGPGALSASQWLVIATLPAAVAVWVAHPLLTLRSIVLRKRRRREPSLLFWRTGLIMALLLIPLSGAAALAQDDRWAVLFGWLAIWGWAGMIMHGMLTRIVPFLVWFHRIMPWIGRKPVPSMRALLPERWVTAGFAVHLASVVAGVAAIMVRTDVFAQLTGVLLAATGISLASSMVETFRRGRSPREDPASASAGR